MPVQKRNRGSGIALTRMADVGQHCAVLRAPKGQTGLMTAADGRAAGWNAPENSGVKGKRKSIPRWEEGAHSFAATALLCILMQSDAAPLSRLSSLFFGGHRAQKGSKTAK